MGLAPYGEPKYVQPILEHLVDLKEDGSFRLDLDYFDYCTGLTMTNSRFDALFGGKPRDPSERLDAAPYGSRRLRAAGDRRDRVAADAQPGERRTIGKSLPCRRCRAQLRRQWQNSARADVQEYLGAAGGRRCRRRRRRGARRLSSVRRTAALRRPMGDAMAGGYLGPVFLAIRDRAASASRSGAVFATLADDALVQCTGQGAGRGESGWLVSGTDGIRPARAGCDAPFSAIPDRRRMQKLAQPAGQISRELSVRSHPPCCGRTWPIGSISTATVPTCRSSPTCWKTPSASQ